MMLEKDKIPSYDQALEALRSGDEEVLQEALFGLEIDDAYFVEQIERALRTLLGRPDLTPKQIVGIGRAIHGLKRLPLRTPGLDIKILLIMKNESGAEEYTLYFSADQLITDSGGYVDNGHGSDSFTGTTFRVYPRSREYDNFNIFSENWPNAFSQMSGAELKIQDMSDETLLEWKHPDGSVFWEWIANHA